MDVLASTDTFTTNGNTTSNHERESSFLGEPGGGKDSTYVQTQAGNVDLILRDVSEATLASYFHEVDEFEQKRS
jgi:hypothetical protein